MTGRESLQGGVRPERGAGRSAEAALPEHPLLSLSLGPPCGEGRVTARCSVVPSPLPLGRIFFLTPDLFFFFFFFSPMRLIWVITARPS